MQSMADAPIHFSFYNEKFHLSWEACERLAARVKHQMAAQFFQPEQVVAVGRGGLVPARLLAGSKTPILYEGVYRYIDEKTSTEDLSAYQTLSSAQREIYNTPGTLVVDDVWDKGLTMSSVSSLFPKAHFATLLSKSSEPVPLDFCGLGFPTDRWFVFPWE